MPNARWLGSSPTSANGPGSHVDHTGDLGDVEVTPVPQFDRRALLDRKCSDGVGEALGRTLDVVAFAGVEESDAPAFASCSTGPLEHRVHHGTTQYAAGWWSLSRCG